MKPSLFISLILALLLAISIPLAAQDDISTDDLTDDDAIVLIGELSFSENGDIIMTVTDEETGETEMFIIAPAGAFNPSTVEDGDVVIIMGRLLPDGMTVQAAEFEFFVEEEEEPEVDPEATPEMEMTEEPPIEEDEEPVVTCGNSNHPVAARFAAEFEMSVDDIMAMHCDGNGFGNIARALLLAQNDENGATAQDFLDRHRGGEGWGQIVRESGMHPSELAPGQIGRNRNTDEDDSDDTTAASQPGNGNGRGNGNSGNNGNNGNNGNGNNGNNGNGRGNGGGNNGNKGGKNK